MVYRMIELTRLNTHILDCRAIVINQMPLAQDGPCWFKSFSFYYRICHRIDIGKSGKKIIREGRISLSLTAGVPLFRMARGNRIIKISIVKSLSMSENRQKRGFSVIRKGLNYTESRYTYLTAEFLVKKKGKRGIQPRKSIATWKALRGRLLTDAATKGISLSSCCSLGCGFSGAKDRRAVH
jgi:hypothetical protein